MKLIIKNNIEAINEIECLEYVKRVIGMGLVSSTNNQRHYCHVSLFDCDLVKYKLAVYASITKSGTHVFTICEE